MAGTSRQIRGRYGGLLSWANTVDRTARTDKARRNGPGDLAWHLERLDPAKFAEATETQMIAAAEAAKKAWFAGLAMRSAAARRRAAEDVSVA